MVRGRGWIALLGLVSIPLVTACELEEVTIVEVEPSVVAEVYVNLSGFAAAEVLAFLHRTIGSGGAALPPLDESVVTITRPDGSSFTLRPAPLGLGECVGGALPEGEDSACLVASLLDADQLRPGELITVDIVLPGGGRLEGAALVPDRFDLVQPSRGVCRLPPESLLPVRWTSSEGAWAYVNETRIYGLSAVLPDSIDAPEPLDLLGLSISRQDTTIVFPSEFGVFDRLDLDRDLSVVLQDGLPAGVTADVIVTATDRNFVNWVRGGNFNPSGQVRVPSLRGDGTGVFGATFRQAFYLVVSSDTLDGAPCPVP